MSVIKESKPQIFEATDHQAILKAGRERHKRNNPEHAVTFADEPLTINPKGFVFDDTALNALVGE